MTLLEASELEALERLALATRRKLLGTFSGDHRSKRFGSSLDFADYREYRPGDDFRRIDAALSARLDRPYLKLFEAEEDLPVRVVLDLSASMGFGEPPKARAAMRIAAAFAHLGLLQHDRARIYVARDGGAEASRWLRGRPDVHDGMRWLEGRRPGGGSGVEETVRAIHDEGRAGILVLVSDLLVEGWEGIVRRLAPPGEAVVVQVLARDELEPGLEGDLTLVDAESGMEVPVSVGPRELDAYHRRLDEWLAAVRSACTSRGCAHVLARADDDVVELFMRGLRRERVTR